MASWIDGIPYEIAFWKGLYSNKKSIERVFQWSKYNKEIELVDFDVKRFLIERENPVVVDAGYHPAEKCGDIDLDNCKDRSLAYTPVPGGVGPMTIAMLMEQSVMSAEKYWGI